EGAPFVLDVTNFSEKAKDVDLVITGEGKTDAQTASGKLPVAVAARAKALGKPVVCVCGCAEPTEAVYDAGIDAVFSITNRPMRLEDSIRGGKALIRTVSYNIARLYLALLKANT
ncbi:MAG: glycerate kinase, partial [Clostridia bacterium]|nr:glycerate kinase [Clostridia bacterium]